MADLESINLLSDEKLANNKWWKNQQDQYDRYGDFENYGVV